MTEKIEIIRKTRAFLLETLKDLNAEQLNKIPEGFNNNIIWNLGHVVATQQGVCYARAGITPKVDEGFIAAYKTGSKPEKFVDDAEIAEIKALMFSTLDDLEADLSNQVFNGYTAWMTRYNVELSNIDEAVNFLQFHEGLHYGYSTALKRLVM